MSRIGRKAIPVPAGVTVNIDGQQVSVKGPKGELAAVLVDNVEISQGDDGISVNPRSSSKTDRSMWGMSRTVVSNLVNGVHEGFSKKLEINGVGYRAQLKGRTLVLNLGFSHDVEYAVPEGVDVACPVQTEIVISGIDKQKVGQVAAEIRAYRPPEPYKGKGVKYSDEYIFRKEGKKK
ncbi:MAG: 50S ribosomal protein L6 [Hyphomicrobiales bacterium]|nr:MAG: 50S ribosomal protein L6 [Hyphomicrobiales bacterium]